MVGHWLSAVIIWGDGGIKVYNVVGVVSGLWVTTWVLQVMPLFFFVGGFANLMTLDSTLRRGAPASTFLGTRFARLLKPTSIFIAVWFLVLAILYLAGVGGPLIRTGSILAFGPLWFLGVYLVVVAATPVMLKLHRRFGLNVIVALVALTFTVDFLRFWINIPLVSWANLAFVWLFVHQLGFFYADGTLVRASRWVHTMMALLGLTGLILLTSFGVYPRSMVGTAVEEVSNMSPPTVCIAALTLWLVGLAMLLRNPLNRWLNRLRPWMTVILANSMIMTIYLWHLTAYAIAFLLLYVLGPAQTTDVTLSWWLQRPVLVALSAVILVGLLGIFGRFERPGRAVRAHDSIPTKT